MLLLMEDRMSFAVRAMRNFLVMAMAGAVVCACDDRPPIPPELLDSTEEPQTPPPTPRPTTQQLTDGPYSRIKLDILPLTLDVPTGWKIERLGSLVLLEGYTPVDQARVQLAVRDRLPQSQVDALHSGAQKEAAADKGAQMSVELRELPGMKILERRSVGRTIAIPVTDAQGVQKLDDRGNPISHSTTPMRWRLNFFVPAGKDFDQFELNFIDLSVDQYTAERSFLERIVYSVMLDAPAPPPATAPAGPR
jgi:hypothetical protein